MARKKHLINVHTSTGTEAPSGASLYLGEVAVQHTPDNPALWIKMGTSEASEVYEKFIGETEILTLINNSSILGSGYTYSGIPYVNSATTIADAYSALTNEVIKDELAISAAFNDLNDRVRELEQNSGSSADLEALSAAVVYNYNYIDEVEFVAGQAINDLDGRVSALEEDSGTSSSLEALSASVVNNVSSISTVSGDVIANSESISALSATVLTNVDAISALSATVETIREDLDTFSGAMLDKEYVIAQSLNNLNDRLNELSGNSGSQEVITALSGSVMGLSAATSAHASNSGIHLPEVTASDDGKIMKVVNGVWTLSNPVNIYTGTDTPTQSLGNNGDLFLQS